MDIRRHLLERGYHGSASYISGSSYLRQHLHLVHSRLWTLLHRCVQGQKHPLEDLYPVDALTE